MKSIRNWGFNEWGSLASIAGILTYIGEKTGIVNKVGKLAEPVVAKVKEKIGGNKKET